jgi:hypothetical protein
MSALFSLGIMKYVVSHVLYIHNRSSDIVVVYSGRIKRPPCYSDVGKKYRVCATVIRNYILIM